ncbi:MAG: Asp-tRNA(Asn)/Glu-tRNA(Gln) amidotransferase subunit GatC [Candidatus Saccharibacteria bacterium]|nr:Asp-tRNA(Asn)/Glu-tRNA(Gln) amidotransferase subunit GatC [Candidatus Saccharibacteria bacterium]
MDITREQIDHLAELSDFKLEEAEKESLRGDLENIIKYISELDSLDTEGIEPTYQVFEMENVWREDEILPQDADREKLLKTAPAFHGKEGVEDYQIKVPKVL